MERPQEVDGEKMIAIPICPACKKEISWWKPYRHYAKGRSMGELFQRKDPPEFNCNHCQERIRVIPALGSFAVFCQVIILILGVFFSVGIVENEVIFRKPIIVALCLVFLVPIPIVYRRTSVEKVTEGEK